MDFNNKVNTARGYYPLEELQFSVESDRGRIINSAAIRRLQQKTQVFPLERNAAVRSRLTHSLEVQQVGRYIVQRIVANIKWRQEKGYLNYDYGFCALERSIESLVEMACLMHDIGNPPFGHFGERAISDWFVEASNPQCGQSLAQLVEMPKNLKTDLLTFEGNAQAIRLICSLLKLNLSYCQIAAVFKYTRPGDVAKEDAPKELSYVMKKPGFYLTEEEVVGKMQQALAMDPGCRHPLSYIMEAADDISYCIADIEDGVEKHILTVEQVVDELAKAYQKLGGDLDATLSGKTTFGQILSQSFERYEKESIDKVNQFFVFLRVKINHVLVNHAVKRFVDNIEEIYHGRFNSALLEDDSAAHKLAESLKTVAFAHVFNHREVQEQEIKGYRIIQGLLSVYRPVLALSAPEFRGLMDKDSGAMKKQVLLGRLVARLPGKHRRAYQEAVAKLDNSATDYLYMEYYHRCRLMQDYVSGMTDQYALDEYQKLMVTP